MTGGAIGRPAELATAHARLLRDSRFQFDFADWAPPRPAPAPLWLKALLEGIAALLPYAFWTLVIGGAGFLAVLLVQAVRSGGGVGRRRSPVRLDGEALVAPGRARARLAQADGLAEEGRFGEAVHVLLFRTLDDIEERRPGLLRASLTSREIARLEALPEPARPPLARIAAAVERVVFAGRDADADVFRACREDYVRFAGAAR